MKRFVTFVRKEFYHVFRDNKTLLLLFGLPVAQIVLFGFALTNEIKNSKIVVADHARDEVSFQIIEKLSASRYFEIESTLLNNAEIEEYFKRGDIKLAVVFPNKLQQELSSDHVSQIQVIADATDPNTASTLTSYVSSIINDYQQDLNISLGFPVQIVPEVRMLYNPNLKGTTNFVPGVMALVLLLVCVLMTSVSIVKEKEKGTMELLLVSPMQPFVIIISKAIPYFFLSLINLTVIVIMSVFLLGMPLKGSVVLLYTMSSIFILCALSLGLLISNSTNSQQAAMLISLMGMMLPTVLFSGFMFPLENMPLPLQWFANIVPSKWYYNMVKAIMIKGVGITAIWKEATILMGMTIVLLIISFKKFKIRMS